MTLATTPTQLAIREVCREVGDILVEKNRAYGNSALDPVRIFSEASPREQLLVRIDDKLSRIARGGAAGVSEDVVLDLIGYLVLLRVQDGRKAPESFAPGEAISVRHWPPRDIDVERVRPAAPAPSRLDLYQESSR